MSSLHVIPIKFTSSLLCNRLVVNASLSDVFFDDFLSVHLNIFMVKSTEFSVVKALFFFKLFITVSAIKSDKMRSHQNFVSKKFIILLKVINEIKSSVISRCIPNVILNSVVWIFHVEGNNDLSLLNFL